MINKLNYKSLKQNDSFIFFLIGIFVLLLNLLCFWFPIFPSWLPASSQCKDFVLTLWQVHASIIGVAVVVVTVIVTILANETDRARTWNLYLTHSWFLHATWFNLLALVSEGVVSLLLSDAPSPDKYIPCIINLASSAMLLFLLAILLTARVYYVTIKFLDTEYVEDLAEKRLIEMIPRSVDEQIIQKKALIKSLNEQR